MDSTEWIHRAAKNRATRNDPTLVNFRIPKRLSLFWAAVPLMLLCWNSNAMAATNTATAGTTWAGATWSLGHVPTSSEDAAINSGVNLTIGTAAVCGSLTIGNATATATTLTIGAGGSLVVSGTTGNLSINPSAKAVNMTLAVGAQTLTVAGSVSMAATNTQTISVSTGTITFNSAVSLTTTNAVISVTSTGTINFNGGFTDGNTVLSEVSGSTINFGGNYTVQTAAVTWTAGADAVFTGNATITPTAAITFGDLMVNSSATATVGGAVTVAGSFVVNGTLGGTGTITLSGAATNIDGTGSITNTATLTISAAHTILSTANLSFSGTISISGSITVTNNGTVTTTAAGGITGSASGSTWSQGTTGTLNITGPLLATGTLTASASGNTVNYNGAAQTVKATATYHHLTLGGSGTKTLTTTTTAINGNLTLSGTATATTVVGLTISGSLNVGSGTTFTAAAFALTVSGATSVTGTLTISSATGTKAFNGDVTINNGGTWNNTAANAALTLPGNISNSGTFNAGTGVHTLSGTSKTISGTFSIPSVTVSGTYQNNGTLTVTTALAGSGTLTNGATGTLNINFTGAMGLTNLTATASGNMVNYGFAGTQTIKATIYDDLTLSNSGAKTAAGALTVNGDFTMSGSASFNGGTSLTHTFLGNWIVNTSAATPFSFTTASTINLNTPGTPAATSLSGSSSATIGFNNVNLNNTSGFSSTENFSITGTLTVAANVTFSPSSSAVVSGAGTLTGNGTVQVTRATGSSDFTNQYTITNKTLTNLTVEFAGASAQGTGANTYGGLKINNASGVTLSGNVTVNGTLTLASGNVTTSSNKVIISSTGSVSRTSGQVVGNLQKNFGTGSNVSRTFEIGDASNYTPVTVVFTSVTVAGDLIASTTAGDHPNIGTSTFVTTKTANRYWTLTNSGITFTTYDVTLNFVSGDLDSGANTSNFIVGRFASSTWTYPTVGTKTSTSMQATVVTAFGNFQVGEASTTATWTGAVNNLWSNGGNWSGLGGQAPVAGDDLIFPSGASNLSTSNDIAAGTSFNSITISGSGYTLAGNSIALGAGDLNDTNTSGSNTISLAISMSATRTFSINNAGETLTASGVISGAGGLIKNGGAGKLILSGANTYSGTTTINVGILSITADNNLGTAPGSATAGQLTFVGGTLATTASFTLNANRGISFSSTGTIDVTSSTTLAYGGVAAGSGGLTKTSAGTLTLSGANTYTGATTINGGVVSIAADNNLGAAPGSATAGQLTFGSGTLATTASFTLNANRGVAFSSTGTIDVASGITLTYGGVAAGSGGLNKTSAGTLTLSGNNTYTGTTTVSAGTLLVNGSQSSSAVSVNGGTLGGTGTVGTITSTASGGSVAPGSAGPGLLNSGNVDLSASGTRSLVVELNGTTAGSGYDQLNVTGTVNLTGASLSGTVGFTPAIGSTFAILNNDGSDAVTGTFAGLSEGSNVVLSGYNFTISYTGGTGNDVVLTRAANTFTWDGGGADNNWTAAANWVGDVAPGAGDSLVFDATGVGARPSPNNDFAAATNFGTITVAAGGYTIGGNSVSLTSGLTASNASGSSTVSLVIGGAGTVTKTSAGTFTLSGANSYTGTTTISAGVLNIQNASALGATSSGTTVDSSASLQLQGGIAVGAESLTLNNAGVSGAGAIENVSGANSWSGAITLGSASTIGSTSGTITVSGNVDNATFGLTVGGTGNTTLSGVISNTGALTKSGAGTLTLSGVNTFGGNSTISAGTLKLGVANAIPDGGGKGDLVMNPSSGTATFDLGGFSETINGFSNSGAGSSVVDNSASSTTPTLTVGGNNVTSTFSGVIQNTAGTLALTKTGTGTLTLSGANAFGGNTTINAGSLSISADSNLGTAPGSAAAGKLTFGGGTLVTTATFTLNSNRGIAFNSTGTIDVASGTTLTYVGIAAGSGGLAKSNAGTLILSGANTYSGATTISAGTISISADNNLGTAPGSAVAGQLTLGGGTLATTVSFTLNSNRGIAFNSTATIDVASSTTLTYGGIAAGSGGLTKTSAGILVLNGNNTYTGATAVSSGTVMVNGSQGSSAVSLNGGTLGGTGTVGTITSTSSGGTVSPGSSPGILNASDVNWSTGSPTFSIELNGTAAGSEYDQLSVAGTVNLSGATLNGSVGFAPAAGTTFTIINNDGSDAVIGTFSGLSEGSSVTLSGQTFTISYAGGTGNDVVLTRASPNVTIDNTVNPSGTQSPETDLTYTITFTNTQCCAAQSLVIKDPIPANTDFKVGSETHNLGTTGLTVVVDYSNDNESTWTYTPVSGGGGAPAGYDRSVTNIRWTFSGNLSQSPPNNNGSVSFITRIR
jgi:fibronectin-binding autotransporter adhesin